MLCGFVEYGMGSNVSAEGDVYSFGILLLEMFTGKRPTDNDFDETMNLNQLVTMALPERVMEIVARGLITEGEQDQEATSSSNTSRQTRRSKIQHQCVISMLIIGVMCSEESTSKRMKIKDALKELLAIKNMLLKDGKQRN
ncbi:Tyrosine-protein kinase [Parasponia andersonii]|uniref:Tyrosine-protein kinase n=1 Tax=Parasponia andersonii TaxID=3476 RepID=A0A2P5CM33_PARAD|nr:Tyrosine-protein kinase [Parasponia andersonii]